MKKKETKIITILSLIIFLLAFLLSNRLWFRVDMTKNKAYTISEVSRMLHREITDIATITYFISPRLRALHPMPGLIADQLREYAAHSRGRVRFIQRDPAGLGRRLEELGIMPWQIQVTERNETIHATVYSGILIEYLGRESVIPLVFSLDTLEYDISSRLRSLVRNTSREIGIIVGDAHLDWHRDYALLNHALLLSGFLPRVIEPGSAIPITLPALFVLGGTEDLDIFDLFPIDEYIMNGGNVLFALNGVFVDSRGVFDTWIMQDMGLLAMLANYGVIVRQALALDISALALTFQTHGAGGTQVQTVRYPHWIAVQEQPGVNHPVSFRSPGLDLFWPSPLELVPPPGVNAEIIFSSSPEAWLQTERFVTNPNWISQFEDERDRTVGTKVLSASLSGNFPSAFASPHSPLPPHSLLPSPYSRIIVIGDVNFAGHLMQTTHSEERNLEFFIRSAEWLSGGEDLLALRGRETMPGRLDRISDPEARDAVMAFSRFTNTVFIPLSVIIAGFIICKRRKKNEVQK